MEPLIFKIETQADDSGVRKFDKSVGGLDSSAKKASAALGSFSRDLLNARSGADVAAAGADALSRVLQKSLAGAVVIGGIKIVADQIEQMAQVIRSAGEATGAAVTQLERMGEVKGLEDATRAVGVLDGSLETVKKQLGSIQSGNWFTQLSDAATGASKELKEQIISLERLRDGQIALGFAAERSSAERIQGLTDEQKQYDAIDQRLNKRLELADKISNQSLKAAAIQDANALAEIEKRNLTIKLTEEQGKKEADLATQREKDAAAQLVAMEKIREAQQKRFNELYDAEVKSQEQMQKRIDAELKAEEAKAARQQELQQNLAQAQESQKQNTAAQASSIASSMSGGSQSVVGGQRKTSYEVGLEKAQERAFVKGKRDSADAEMQRTIDQIKQERAAAGDTRFTGKTDAMNRMAEEAVKAAEAQGKASSGTNEMAKSVETAQSELSNFSDTTSTASYETDTFSTDLSDLGTDFDSAMESADNFSKGLTENSGNMIDDFLNTGKESDELGKDFNETSDEVNRFGEAVKKNTPPPQAKETGKGSKSDDPLTKIHKLLEDNLKEMRTYAFVK